MEFRPVAVGYFVPQGNASPKYTATAGFCGCIFCDCSDAFCFIECIPYAISIFAESKIRPFINIPIRQPKIPDEGIMNAENGLGISTTPQIRVDQDSFLKIGVAEVGLHHTRSGQVGIPQTSVGQINVAPTSFDQASTTEVSFSQVNIGQFAVHHEGATQVRFSQVASSNSNSAKTSTHQIDTTQVNVLQNPTQPNSSKISLPGSITLQQFLSSHHFNLQNNDADSQVVDGHP